MKKTLVALSVLAAASAQAGFEIYNQDGVTVNMGGDIEVVYVQAKKKDSNPVQEIQDADLDFDVRYAVNDSFQVGGFWQFTDVGQTEGDAYVAVYSDNYGSLKFGRTCTALDDAGIGSDYQFGLNTFFNGSEVYCADEIARYDFDNGTFHATLAAAQDMNGNESLSNSSTFVDGKLGYRVADFDLVAFYGNGTMASGVEETLWSAQVKYSGIENVELAAAYYDMTGKPSTGDKTDTDTIALAATYSMDKVTFAAGYSMSSSNANLYGTDVNGNQIEEKDLNAWYINAGYSIAPNTTLYAEVGGDDGYTGTTTNNYTFNSATGGSTLASSTTADYVKNDIGFAVGVKAFF
jgi:predicted porin